MLYLVIYKEKCSHLLRLSRTITLP